MNLWLHEIPSLILLDNSTASRACQRWKPACRHCWLV